MTFDLSTTYGGLRLNSPIVVGACPMTMDEPTRIAMQDAGAGALVLPSVFEEDVIRWTARGGRSLTGRRSVREIRDRPIIENPSGKGAGRYLEMIRCASRQLAIPVIASLNGSCAEDWLSYIQDVQQAGAAAVELNIHHGPNRRSLGMAEMEDSIAGLVSRTRKTSSLPLFLKLKRGAIHIPHLARRICSGADGIVLFGRQPEIDICLDSLKISVCWNLTSASTCIDLIRPIMETHSSCPAMSLAASGGIATGADAIKVFLAGADVAMVTSELYRSGPDAIRTVTDGLIMYLEKHRFQSIRELQLQRPIEFQDREERMTYMAALSARLENNCDVRHASPMLCDRFGHPVGQQHSI